MKTVVCFGDSITWGCPPAENLANIPARLARGERWPGVLQAQLPEVHVVEEGLGGRTTVFDDPIEGEHKNGLRTLIAVLESHAPIDVFIIMLGTNDFKAQFNLTAFTSARGMLTLIQALRGYYVLAGTCPEVLIVTPPALSDAAEPALWGDAVRRGAGYGHYLKQVGERTGCFHFDSNRVVRVGVDGVHIDVAGHRALGQAIALEVRRILSLPA